MVFNKVQYEARDVRAQSKIGSGKDELMVNIQPKGGVFVRGSRGIYENTVDIGEKLGGDLEEGAKGNHKKCAKLKGIPNKPIPRLMIIYDLFMSYSFNLVP